jgi:arylsulfatase/arylsulfatase A
MKYLSLVAALLLIVPAARAADRPNVILIVTDDQGYGDLGAHGNPVVRTPNLDAMAKRSAVLTNFYVSPVCTPTRASLMTGRYNYRTRAIDTYRGRAMMDPDEVTVAQLLHGSGYATGIFGKWHLGDTYPLRAMDRGFDEALVHRGGGIGQPSDPPGGEGKYTDPILFRDGEQVTTKGYCTDIYFREGMKWAEDEVSKGRPFFLYLATNAPHAPYTDVPPDKLAYYKTQAISPDRFPKTPGHPMPARIEADTLARVYAMIENIDDNVGRLFAWLDRRGLTDNTLVVFFTDNGPATVGFNAGYRGHKTDVYEGGLRSPFFAHWPNRLKPGTKGDRIAAHIDLLPTLLDACGVAPPKGLKIDGLDLLPLLEGRAGDWPDRALFFQAHRGDVPATYHNCAMRTQEWKLVRNSGFGREKPPAGEPVFELFDMKTDPFETTDVAARHPDVVRRLKKAYDDWFNDVSSTRPDNYSPPRILLGTAHENPVVLTRQDWRGADWGPKANGHWEVRVAEEGEYDVTLRFQAPEDATLARVAVGNVAASQRVDARAKSVVLRGLKLPKGDARLTATVGEGAKATGVRFVEVLRR